MVESLPDPSTLLHVILVRMNYGAGGKNDATRRCRVGQGRELIKRRMKAAADSGGEGEIDRLTAPSFFTWTVSTLEELNDRFMGGLDRESITHN